MFLRLNFQGIGNVGALVFDRNNRVIYFTDVLRGQLESINVDSGERKTIYRGMKPVRKLSFTQTPNKGV